MKHLQVARPKKLRKKKKDCFNNLDLVKVPTEEKHMQVYNKILYMSYGPDIFNGYIT